MIYGPSIGKRQLLIPAFVTGTVRRKDPFRVNPLAELQQIPYFSRDTSKVSSGKRK